MTSTTIGSNLLCFYNINGCQINNATSFEKIRRIRRLFDEKENLEIVCLLECKIKSLNARFFEIFPRANFTIKFSPQGDGHLTIMKLFSNFRVQHRVVNENLVLQTIFPRDPSNEQLLTTTITYVPPRLQLNNELRGQILNSDLVGGDLNIYLDSQSPASKDRLFQRFMEDNDFEPTTTHRTFDTQQYAGRRRSSPLDGGPDVVIKKTNVSPRIVEKLPVLADHAGLLFSMEKDPTPEHRNNHGRNSHCTIKLVNPAKIDQNKLKEHFDNLPKKPTINHFRSIWKSILSEAEMSRRLPISILNERKLSPLGSLLKSASTKEDLDKVWSKLLDQTSSLAFLGQTHFILNTLSDDIDEAVRAEKIQEIISRDVNEKVEFFNDIKKLLSTREQPSQETVNNNNQAREYWSNVRKTKSFEYFRYHEIRAALSSMNRKSCGMDNISWNLLPKTTNPSHVRKLLYAINNLIFGSRKLPRWLLEGRLTLVPKNSPGVRPISGNSRVLVLIDSMVSQRLNKAIRLSPQMNNKYGFIENRSTEDFLGTQLKIIQKAKSQGSMKIGICQADLSRAYDMTDWGLLTTKVYRFIKSFKKRSKFSCILGWLLLWLDDRRRLWWYNKTINIKRGLPQGSPLSCCLFVVFYDYSAPENNDGSEIKQIFFADDSSAVITANSMARLCEAMNSYASGLQQWALENKMSISTSKSECLLVDTCSSAFDNDLPYRRTKATRLLGVQLDDTLSFSAHIKKLKLWTTTRARVLYRMSVLGLNEKMKYQILFSLLNSLVYGHWWLYYISETNFTNLEGFWNKLVKSAFEVRRPVPPETLLQKLGLQNLRDTFIYRSAKTLLENRLDKSKPDLLDQVIKAQKQQTGDSSRNNNHRTSKMSRRKTTAEKTKKSLNEAESRSLGFQPRMIEVANLCYACTQQHKKDWIEATPEVRKRILKMIFLKRRERPELELIKKIVEDLNEEYAYHYV